MLITFESAGHYLRPELHRLGRRVVLSLRAPKERYHSKRAFIRFSSTQAVVIRDVRDALPSDRRDRGGCVDRGRHWHGGEAGPSASHSSDPDSGLKRHLRFVFGSGGSVTDSILRTRWIGHHQPPCALRELQ
jgi:hypothetical protein